MTEGSNGGGYPLDGVTKATTELTTQVRGLNISIVNLTNAINRYTTQLALTNHAHTMADQQILDNTQTILGHVVEIKQKVG